MLASFSGIMNRLLMLFFKKQDQVCISGVGFTSIERVAESPDAQTLTIRTKGSYVPGERYYVRSPQDSCELVVETVQKVGNRDAFKVVFRVAGRPRSK
jgi:hypothetical protein